jgi:hypothetical protein
MGLIKSRRPRWVGLVACMGKRRGLYAILVGKPEGKRLLLTLRRRWEDDIKMDERMKGRGLHSFVLGQGEVAGCCGHGNEFTLYSKYKYTYYQNTHTIVKTPTHTHTHILQNKLKQPQYKIHTK